MDNNFKTLLEKIKSLPNTIMFVNTVKGSLTGKLGRLRQGVLEYRRPFLSAYVSKDIQKKYKIDTSRTSQLSTLFDVHETIRQIVSTVNTGQTLGKSLLQKMEQRSCRQAGVSRAMCPCM